MVLSKELEELGEYLTGAYPSVMWAFQRAETDVTKIFGDGFVLIGIHEGDREEFFILNTDKHKRKWGDVIAARLTGSEIELGSPQGAILK